MKPEHSQTPEPAEGHNPHRHAELDSASHPALLTPNHYNPQPHHYPLTTPHCHPMFVLALSEF